MTSFRMTTMSAEALHTEIFLLCGSDQFKRIEKHQSRFEYKAPYKNVSLVIVALPTADRKG